VNPAIPAAIWCKDARQDPITGLVAFPDFNFVLPDILSYCESRSLGIGIAIGDVDNLKEYVENSKSMDPSAFGHMAGCALMQQLGLSASSWFATLKAEPGCVATFGGDEIIIALAVKHGAEDSFNSVVFNLRNELYDALPRSVSFGWTVGYPRAENGADIDRQYYRGLATNLLSTVDQALFRKKSNLRENGLPCVGFVTKAHVA
jgi:GGDEF domain-containing protein